MFTFSRRFYRATLFAVLSLFPVILIAQNVERDSIIVTIYQDFGWVEDRQEATLESGSNRLSIFGVARQIDPGSVEIDLNGEVRSLRTDLNYHGWRGAGSFRNVPRVFGQGQTNGLILLGVS